MCFGEQTRGLGGSSSPVGFSCRAFITQGFRRLLPGTGSLVTSCVTLFFLLGCYFFIFYFIFLLAQKLFNLGKHSVALWFQVLRISRWLCCVFTPLQVFLAYY